MAAGQTTLGYGTWSLTDWEACVENVTAALDAGYRHIDTAQAYDNEALVGDALKRTDVPREDLLVATKVDTSNLAYDDVIGSVEQSRDDLGVETIDLLYVHWPRDTYNPKDTLPAFDELVDRGVVNRVGLSNFRVDQLEEATDVLDAPIFAHQIECHPLLPQEELRAFADETNHHLVAYSPLAKSEVFDVPEITAVADKHNASPAQVSLAWLIAKGTCPIPKARGDHITDNYGALELVDALDPEDIDRIGSIDRETRLIDPNDAPWNE